jgi:hypothetical protein
MLRLVGCLLVMAVLAVPFVRDTSAQAKPDFSGTWTLVSSTAGDAAAYPGRATDLMFGIEAVVTQNATTVTITPTGSGKSDRFVFGLDGSESRNTYKESSSRTWALVSRAKWDGDTLVIVTIVETVTAVDGASPAVVFRDTMGDSERIMRWSMTASGDMAMQTTALHIVDAAAGARGPATHRLVYKKIGLR